MSARPSARRSILVRAAALLLASLAGVLLVATPAAAAGTPGLAKDASVDTAGPGDAYTYSLVPSCSGLQEGCANAVLTDPLPPEVTLTSLPPSTAEYTVAYDNATRTVSVTFLVPLPSPPNAPGSVGLTAGSSFNLEIGVQVPAESQIPNGATIANTATLTADGAAPVAARADVTALVPRIVSPVATKTWSDGSAVAGSDEASTITLGVRNGSSSSTQITSLALEDATPAVFDRFDVTGVGPVTFPAGADRVTVLACAVVLSACADADYTTSAPQSGPGLTLPVPATTVTGLRFVFTSSIGAALPYDATGGSVDVVTVLRDTLRSTGSAYSPTQRDDVQNCAQPSAVDTQLGSVAGAQACATYAVQPAQATVTPTKSFFSDTNGDFSADGQAVVGQGSPASALTSVTNSSPFPLGTVTITEPSATSASEYTKLAVTDLRLVFPAGATTAALSVTCVAGGPVQTTSLTAPPSTVNAPTGCGGGVSPASVSVTYTGIDGDGNATIAQGATARLGVRGTLTSAVDDQDVTDGVLNCADVAATSTINGVGSAAATPCTTLPVLRAFSDVAGVKSAQLPTILPGLPRRFDLSFTNSGTIAATNVVMADPVNPAAAGNSFDVVRLASLTLPPNPAAVAELWDPTVSAYVPFDAGDPALLERARGFRVTVPTLAPGATYELNFNVILRDGVPFGTTFQNCAGVGSDTQALRLFCAGTNTVTDFTSGASVQKSIVPPTSVRPQPGLAGTPIQVKLATQNTGTLFLKRLVVTDTDPAFFDAVDVSATNPVRVNFPPGADRVQVAVCTATCSAESDFTLGTVYTNNQTPPLPAGVASADVRGIRVTFSARPVATPTDPADVYRIAPGTNFPTRGACTNATVCLSVVPRAMLRSDPTAAVPATLNDTATGGYESRAQTPDTLAPVPASSATHTLTSGTAALRFSKSPDRSVTPGEGIPFVLTTTNTGTGPIPGLTVVDPLPAPIDFSPLDPTQPYQISYTLPAGAPEPPQVVFTPIFDATTGKVTSLRWDFPGWDFLPGSVVSIGFRAILAPGVTAGQVIENRSGASSAGRSDLAACPTSGVPRPGTATNDPAFGPGQYCTSGAAISVTAGNAFRTDKWVAGDDALQYLDTLTNQIVPLDDPACPHLNVGGQQFTRYPCVARVEPGQGFDFFLQLTNAGTNPAVEVRVVDVFPHPGDTGVLLTNDQRGTEWDQPPTLLSPVTITGSGALTTDYTLAPDPVCTSDLSRPPVACPPSAWPLTAYEPDATAFRAKVTFATPLAPGASTGLRFRMAAPTNPTDPAQDEVAWNSFAHTEFFQQGASIVQLPPTEPIKTGVALVYGNLTVTKQVTGGTATGPFGFAFECTVTPEVAGGAAGTPVIVRAGAFVLITGASTTIALIPAGASCAVWETDSGGLISDTDGRANAQVVTIGDGTTSTVGGVTVSNAVPGPPPPPQPPTGGVPPGGGSPGAPGVGGSVSGPAKSLASTGVDADDQVSLALAMILAGLGALVGAGWGTRRQRLG